MTDALTFLDQEFLRERAIDPDRVLITFIAVNLSSIRNVEKSVLSIDRIGDEIGRKFEILLTSRVNSRYDDLLFRDMERKIDSLSIIRIRKHNNGLAKRVASFAATGEYLIFFDPSVVYDLSSADLIANYMGHGENAVLISDLTIIPKSTLIRAGGFRDLVFGEDIDLLARISSFTNLIAFPVKRSLNIEAQGNPLLFLSGELRKILARYGMKLGQAQSDQILACNYGLSDIRLFAPAEKGLKFSQWFVTIKSILASRFSKFRPVHPRRNNLVYLMDKILESMVLKDYLRIPGLENPPVLRISDSLICYLKKRSDSWKHIKQMDFIVSREDDRNK